MKEQEQKKKDVVSKVWGRRDVDGWGEFMKVLEERGVKLELN